MLIKSERARYNSDFEIHPEQNRYPFIKVTTGVSLNGRAAARAATEAGPGAASGRAVRRFARRLRGHPSPRPVESRHASNATRRIAARLTDPVQPPRMRGR